VAPADRSGQVAPARRGIRPDPARQTVPPRRTVRGLQQRQGYPPHPRAQAARWGREIPAFQAIPMHRLARAAPLVLVVRSGRTGLPDR